MNKETKETLGIEKWKIVMMIIKEYFRKTNKTNWGKNQIIEALDDIQERIETVTLPL